jgi:hypothetical protein
VALAKHPAIKLPKLVLLMRLLAKVSNSGKTEALQPQQHLDLISTRKKFF